MRHTNRYSINWIRILEVLQLARPGALRAAVERTASVNRNASVQKTAAMRREQHNAEAAAAVSAMRLIR
jgi:hypothetical protein